MSVYDMIHFPPSPYPLAVRRFDPRQDGLRRWFGDLQEAVMVYLWSEGEPRTVKRTWREIQRSYKDIAYTTVMTTMGRLYEDGVLDRVKVGLSYTYRPRETREQFEERQIRAIIASLEATS